MCYGDGRMGWEGRGQRTCEIYMVAGARAFEMCHGMDRVVVNTFVSSRRRTCCGC